MILDRSESGESKTAQTVRTKSSEAGPQSPPPYSPSSQATNLGDQKPLPTPPQSPQATSAGDYGSRLPQGLPPPCNHLIQRRTNDSVKGTWHLDPAMQIPDALLTSMEDFDGMWNESDQKARKERKKLEKKGKQRDQSLPTSKQGVRPNLMLCSHNGSVDAKVHVISSDDQLRTGLIIAEGRNGSVTLDVKTYTPYPLRIYAISENGSVRVRIPGTFEGAVIASSKHGSIKISDPIKSRMTTFSGISDTTRAFIGDWQTAGFGATASSSTPNPNDDPPLPATVSDPFLSWSGPLIHIASRNGSVNLSYSEETRRDEDAGGFSGMFKDFMSGLFGTGGDTRGKGPDAGVGPSGSGGRFPWGGGPPWGHGAPWGDTKHPWGNGAPLGPPMSPPGPFGRGGGSSGRGCGSFRRGGFGGYSSGCSRRTGSDGNAPQYGSEHAWEGDNVERDAYGFPKDKKDPSGA